MERTTRTHRCRWKHNGDPPPDGAVISSELHIYFIIFVASANQYGISFSRKFQSLGAAPSQLERRRRRRSRPGTRMQ